MRTSKPDASKWVIGSGAAHTGDEIPPEGGEVVADRRHGAHAGDDGAARKIGLGHERAPRAVNREIVSAEARAPASTRVSDARPVPASRPMLRAMRLTTRRLLLVCAPALLALLGLSAPAAASGPTLAQMIGQKMVITMSGLSPDSGLLDRIRHGEVGGIALLGSNVSSSSQLVALTTKLQKAAAKGGQPPLLIGIDQEGGSVKRIEWIPPNKTVPQMGAIGSTHRRVQPGQEDRSRPARIGHQHRPCPGRGRARVDRLVHVPAGSRLRVRRRRNRTARRRLRVRARRRRRQRDHEALPGDRPRDPEHRPLRRHDHRVPQGAQTRPLAVPHGDRPRRAADHAVERDVHRLGLRTTPRAGRRTSSRRSCARSSASRASRSPTH